MSCSAAERLNVFTLHNFMFKGSLLKVFGPVKRMGLSIIHKQTKGDLQFWKKLYFSLLLLKHKLFKERRDIET